MKILIFSTAYLPFIGGAELAIKEITDRTPDISFTLITARFKRDLPKSEKIGNVEVYRVGLGTSVDKWLLPWLGFRKAKLLERKESFDVVWSMMASQGSIAAAFFKQAFPQKKLVLTLHEGDEEAHLKRYVFGSDLLYRLLIRPWHLRVFKKADRITAISNYLAERARKNAPNTRMEVIPNGVDIAKFQITNSKLQTNPNLQREEIRKKLGIQKEDKVVITTSRLVEKNGIGDLILAMRYLPENVKLLICGIGHLENSYKLKTSSQGGSASGGKSYKLEDRIRFLGHIPHEQLPGYLHAADIFCRPALSEGMGSSFIEAMAASLPVVATPVGGIPDFLNAPFPESEAEGSLFSNSHELENRWGETITGLFCEVGNPESIAEKVKLLLSNGELRNKIIENASKMVREKYGWEWITKKMQEIFHPLVF